MSYIQGEQVRIRFTTIDPDTGLPTNPPDAKLTVVWAGQSAPVVKTITGGGITHQLDSSNNPIVGKFEAYIDTSLVADLDVTYYVATTGSKARIRKRSFHVDAMPA